MGVCAPDRVDRSVRLFWMNGWGCMVIVREKSSVEAMSRDCEEVEGKR